MKKSFQYKYSYIFKTRSDIKLKIPEFPQMVSELVPLNTHSSDLYCRSPSYFNKKISNIWGRQGKEKKLKKIVEKTKIAIVIPKNPDKSTAITSVKKIAEKMKNPDVLCNHLRTVEPSIFNTERFGEGFTLPRENVNDILEYWK